MSEEGQEEGIKRGPGRPRKSPAIEREPKRYNMKASPNWETFDAGAEDTPDRLRISPELIPDGMAAMWVTDSIFGQPSPKNRSDFERKGWTPVHQTDFDGQFNGMFMLKDAPGEINVGGLVLMVRPKEFNDRARKEERRKAIEQIAIKERALKGGDLPVSLDSRHSSALNTNRITKTVERLPIPEDNN